MTRVLQYCSERAQTEIRGLMFEEWIGDRAKAEGNEKLRTFLTQETGCMKELGMCWEFQVVQYSWIEEWIWRDGRTLKSHMVLWSFLFLCLCFFLIMHVSQKPPSPKILFFTQKNRVSENHKISTSERNLKGDILNPSFFRKISLNT